MVLIEERKKWMKVCVMMSTYNGEKYIKEQIDSLFAQEDIEVHLYIRDDGSTDNTVNEIEKMKIDYPEIHIEKCENIGYAKSFFSLLCSVPDDYEYYAFSDQDDVWMSNKLIDAVEVLKEKHTPCLYSCNLELVDEKLNHIEIMDAPTNEDFSKGRYLIDRYSYGCAMVFNSKLRKIAVNNLPSINISHDNWLGILAVFCGEFIFDDKPNIRYRQHRSNVTGGKSGFAYSWKRRFKNLGRIKDESRCSLANELIERFGDAFDKDTLELLQMVGSYKKGFKNKMIFFFDKRTVRKSKEKNFIFRLMILFSLA